MVWQRSPYTTSEEEVEGSVSSEEEEDEDIGVIKTWLKIEFLKGSDGILDLGYASSRSNERRYIEWKIPLGFDLVAVQWEGKEIPISEEVEPMYYSRYEESMYTSSEEEEESMYTSSEEEVEGTQ